MENKETIVLVKDIETKKTAQGRTYWVIHTDIGRMSTFDDKLAENMKKFTGQKVKVGIFETPQGFMNLKSIAPMSVPSQSIPEEIVPDTSIGAVEARKAKDVSIYTSYVKDLIIAGKPIDEAIELIKKARTAFQ